MYRSVWRVHLSGNSIKRQMKSAAGGAQANNAWAAAVKGQHAKMMH
jgi:hypothetical protein